MAEALNWFKNAVIYQIFIDRFAGYKNGDWDKPDFLGGNIKGIISKLPYLQELGVNVLWISPFYKCSTYHGYHITDFFKVDPRFGTLQDVKELIKQVHKRNMRIIADFVPNHCSHKHAFFLEAQKDKKSPYYKWFYFKKWPDEYVCFLKVKQLPKLNLEYEPAGDHIIKAAKYWLSLGFDGFRLDHVVGPSHDFWKVFVKELKREYPDAILLGEAVLLFIRFNELSTLKMKNKYLMYLIGTTSDALLKSYVGILDGVLDFRFYQLINEFATDFITLQELKTKLKKHYSKFPKDFYLASFLDNHDVNRFLFECKNNKEKLKQAAEIQFSNNQPKVIYYGTEVGMSQNNSIFDFEVYGDLQARQPMKWENMDNGLLEFYKKLIRHK